MPRTRNVVRPGLSCAVGSHPLSASTPVPAVLSIVPGSSTRKRGRSGSGVSSAGETSSLDWLRMTWLSPWLRSSHTGVPLHSDSASWPSTAPLVSESSWLGGLPPGSLIDATTCHTGTRDASSSFGFFLLAFSFIVASPSSNQARHTPSDQGRNVGLGGAYSDGVAHGR